jgi:hypothetical protein
MKIVAVKKTLRVPAEKGAATLIFRAGQRYLLHDDEAAAGIAAASCDQGVFEPSWVQRKRDSGALVENA